MGVVAVVVIGAIIYPQLGQSLLPDFKERDFLMHWVTKPGTSHPEEVRISTRACIELREIEGVRNCGSHIGQALLADEVVGIDFGENWISVDPSVDYDATLASVQEVVDGYPGLRRDVQTYLKERIREVLTGTSEAIVVRVYGRELEQLRETAHDVEEELGDIEGIVDLHTELQADIPQIEVEVDLEAAQQYGIKPGDVRRAAAGLVAGIEVGDIFRNGKATTSRSGARRRSRAASRISSSCRSTCQAAERSRWRSWPTSGWPRRRTASATRGCSAGSTLARTWRGAISAPSSKTSKRRSPRSTSRSSTTRSCSASSRSGRRPQSRLLLFGIAAAIGIFLLLQASFGSTRLAILSFLTLPFALVGGVFAAALTGGVVSLGSLIGFFTVLGIAARNGIMMINHFQHLERYEGEAFGPELVLRGARERLSPILMTALATGLALVPLAIVGDLPGHEIEHPMAIVILGGLVTSTLLNLFVVPSLYLRFAKPRPRPAPAEVAAT